MTKKAQQVYQINPIDMAKLEGQGTHEGARAAWDRVREIEALGHVPAVFYSQFNNGFTVLDENDPEQFKRSDALSRHAKPFPI